MRTRHVTRAATLIGIGQPGMSAALARLRALFADDLLVKQGGEMQPTARALELEPDVRRILQDVERLASGPAAFDPTDSRRTFHLRMSDVLSALLLPP
jgi:DNA-binding transcriptional LysR family regulator